MVHFRRCGCGGFCAGGITKIHDDGIDGLTDAVDQAKDLLGSIEGQLDDTADATNELMASCTASGGIPGGEDVFEEVVGVIDDAKNEVSEALVSP